MTAGVTATPWKRWLVFWTAAVFDADDITEASEVAVACFLATRADNDTGKVNLGNREHLSGLNFIVDRSRTSRSTARRVLKKLQRLGLLRRQNRRGNYFDLWLLDPPATSRHGDATSGHDDAGESSHDDVTSGSPRATSSVGGARSSHGGATSRNGGADVFSHLSSDVCSEQQQQPRARGLDKVLEIFNGLPSQFDVQPEAINAVLHAYPGIDPTRAASITAARIHGGQVRQKVVAAYFQGVLAKEHEAVLSGDRLF